MDVSYRTRCPVGAFPAFSVMTGSGSRTGPSRCGEPAMCALETADDEMLLRCGHGNRTESEAISAIVPGHGNRTGYGVLVACKPICCLVSMFSARPDGTAREARAQTTACDLEGFDCAVTTVCLSCRLRPRRLLPLLLLPNTHLVTDNKGMLKTTAINNAKPISK